jgi:hypothetical protein
MEMCINNRDSLLVELRAYIDRIVDFADQLQRSSVEKVLHYFESGAVGRSNYLGADGQSKSISISMNDDPNYIRTQIAEAGSLGGVIREYQFMDESIDLLLPAPTNN